MMHDLKIRPREYELVVDGRKKHEIRKADRIFQVGDELELREWALQPRDVEGRDETGMAYTGRRVRVHVTHITHGGEWGLPRDLCVMSIELVRSRAADHECEGC